MTPGDWLVALVTWRQPAGWTFAVSGTPVTDSYFTVSAAQAASILAGQQFTDTLNPGILFTVTSFGAPFAGFVNVFFTPSAKVAMGTGDTVTEAGTTVSVADGANWWDPLGQPSGTSPAAGVMRSAIWAAPAARTPPQGTVMIAPTGYYTALAALVYDVSGLSPWSALELISTGYANAATALSLSLAAPAAQSIVFALSGSDNLADTVSLAAGGWPALSTVTALNGIDHTADIEAAAAWQVTTGATTAAWSSTGALDFSAAIAAIAVTGSPPSQPNTMWPYAVTEIAPGSGPGSPPDQLTWVPLTSRVLASGFTQGRQYTLGQLQAGQGTLTLDNPDLALIPPGSGAYAGIDSGTPFRTRCAWAGGAWQVSWTGNGSTASPQAAAVHAATVTPGVTYTTSAWTAASGPYAAGMQIGLFWYTSGGSFLSSSVSQLVPASAQAALMTVTATAPATAARADVVIGALGTPATSVTFYAAAAPPGSAGYVTPVPGVTWTSENAAVITTLAPWREDPRGAPSITPWYVDSAGYFQRWPPSWDAEMLRGQTTATTTDAWGYANTNLQSVLRSEVLSDGPYAYWPCTDPAQDANIRATSGAANIAPGNQNPLNVILSKNGTGGTATQAFGADSGALLGDTITTVTTTQRLATQGTLWQQNAVPASSLAGYSLSCTDSSYPSVTNGVTVAGWFQWTGGLPTTGFLLSLMNTAGNVLNAYLETPGPPNLVLQSLQNAAHVNQVNLLTVFPSGLFHLAIAFNRTTYAAYFNGQLIDSGTWTYTIPAAFTSLWFNGNWAPVGGTGGGTYNGNTAHVAVFPRMLPPARIMSHYQAGAYAMAQTLTGAPHPLAGETASNRIERLLQYASLPGRRAILPDTGPTPVVSCQDIGNQPAATSLTNIAVSTVPAILAVRPAGDIIYTARGDAYNDPVTWVLGDNQAAGEIPFTKDYAPDYDPGRVVNDIQITGLDDQSVTVPTQAGLEASSQLQYGDVTYQPTGYLQNDPLSLATAGPGTQDLADWIAATNAKPQLRAASVTVDASKHPAAWPFVLGAGVGDGVTVNLRPATAGGQLVTITGRITQTTRARQFSQDQVSGSVNCVIDTAPDLNVLTADDPVRGQLTGSNVLGW
jgi:hypothetical protein